jgi:AraC-like DNA-binding protein
VAFWGLEQNPVVRHLRPIRLAVQEEAGWRRRIHWRNATRLLPDDEPYCLFQYTLSGRAMFEDTATGTSSMLRPGWAFFVTVPSPTIYYLPEDAEWKWMWLGIRGEIAFDIVRQLNANHGYLLELSIDSEPIQFLLERLRRGEEATITPYESSRWAHGFLMMICERFYQPGIDYPPAVRYAMDWIETHYSDPALSLDVLAEKAGLSKFHFARVFKASLGQSPGEYLLSRRLSRAQELLSFTQQPVKQIALQVGFRHPAHFGAMFRKRFGTSPGAMRSQPRRADQ